MVKWLWRNVRHDPDVEAADAALARSNRDSEMVKGRWPMINELSRDLSNLRADNNFAARIRAAYGEGHR